MVLQLRDRASRLSARGAGDRRPSGRVLDGGVLHAGWLARPLRSPGGHSLGHLGEGGVRALGGGGKPASVERERGVYTSLLPDAEDPC
ncbi:hypothetical protein THAOC_30681 [Thalassiosira oceanica]|uniref:Uncharacterized protein n=1 Tax=Thalassiosira oceanica TaxID=159749 RepID=K0RUL0_THAOC|nr:hypothetical protein THAOC_30681 [Thalassiosira oceanica]|eukprot:EJK50362.1 hypothetical protein THAOC_30681 [Thalassiosira oceanica]